MKITRNVVNDLLPAREAWLQPAVALPPDLERDTVARTRAQLRRHSWRLGFAGMFALLPLTFAFHGGQITFLMVRDEPWSAIFWVIAGFLFLEDELRSRRLGLRANRMRPRRARSG
jgi:hypothetical protein